ncbi:MAG: EamA family transporter [Burkholderiales bacterium]
MSPPPWLWIAITIAASFAQTLRNATQKHLTAELGALGATLVRFLFGLPFAALWFCALHWLGGYSIPHPNLSFGAWVLLGAVSQIIATALLLRVMKEKSFAVGVAYSKTEALQVAVFGLMFLKDPLTFSVILAVVLGTFGVLLFSPADRARPLQTLFSGWTSRSAALGIASGTFFAFSAVGFRGAALSFEGTPFLMAAGSTLLAAQIIQTVLLGGWLCWRDPRVIGRCFGVWRTSLLAGGMGATASAGWFTAMAIEPVAHVRTLALIELFFGAIVSRRIFRESLTGTEIVGMCLLVASLGMITLAN